MRITGWREDFNHQHRDLRMEKGVQYGDLLMYVDFNYVANVARLNAATLATLASALPWPKEIKVVTKNLDNNTTLTWQAGKSAPAGMECGVVPRAIASPMQEHARVERGHDGDAAWCRKDDVIIRVEMVDGARHGSVAVPPLPAR